MHNGLNNIKMKFFSILFCLLLTFITFNSFSQEIVDLSTWEQRGDLNNGNWVYDSNANSVKQTNNSNPTFYVSDQNFINKTITGEIYVNTSSDDDFIGFVLGFEEPTASLLNRYKFLLVDWKQLDQDPSNNTLAKAEIRLIYYDKAANDPGNIFWSTPTQTSTWGVIDIYEPSPSFPDVNSQGGWEEFKTIEFKAVYSENNVKIFFDFGDGNFTKVFDVDASSIPFFESFPNGRVGFYNYSQNEVIYKNFTVPNGNFEIVSTGGGIEGVDWMLSGNTLIPLSSNAKINSADLESIQSGLSSIKISSEGIFALSDNIELAIPLTIESESIFLNASINSTFTSDDALVFKSKKSISTNTPSVTITTQGGNVLLNSNTDDTAGGAIGLDLATINTNGGNITLSGGSDPFTGYAEGLNESSITGFSLQTPFKGIFLNGTALNAAGGDIILRGKGGDATGVSGDYFPIGIDMVGYQTDAQGNPNTLGTIMNTSGSGSISLNGLGGVNNNANTHAVGINFFENNGGVNSISTTNGSISLHGSDGTGNAIEHVGVLNDGGDVSIYSNTGSINISGTGDTATYGFKVDGPTNIGWDGSTSISSGDITINVDDYNFTSLANFKTTGGLSFQSYGNSFVSGGISFPTSNGILANTISSLIIGKSTNIENISIDTDITINGAISIYGGNVNVNNDINTSLASNTGDILLKSLSDIVLASGKSIITNGSNVVLWANSDGELTNGSVLLRNGTSVSTNSGNVWIGGGSETTTWKGLTVGDGYAVAGTWFTPSHGGGDAKAGVYLENTTVQTSGGNLLIKGDGSSNLWGIVTYGSNTLDSGSGTVEWEGINSSTTSYAGILFGLHDVRKAGNTVFRSSASEDAIKLMGIGKGSGDGVSIDGIVTMESTGAGSIKVLGTGGSSGYGVEVANYYNGSKLNAYAASGDIIIDGGSRGISVNKTSNIGIVTGSSALNVGQGGNVVTSTSDIKLLGDSITLDSTTSLSVNTSGTFALEPFSDSFNSDLTYPISNLSLASSVSGLTIGKSTNSANISINNSVSVAGPINIYGDNIWLNSGADISSTLSGSKVLLRGKGHIVIESNSDLITNNGDLILWSNYENITSGTANNEVDLRGNNTISTSGGDIFIAGGEADANNLPSGYAYRSDDDTIRSADLGQDVTVDSGGGNILIKGQGGGVGVGFSGSGTSLNSDGGSITINGKSTLNHGVWVSNNLSVNTAGGDLIITGEADAHQGIDFEGNGIKLLSGTGDVSIEGTSVSSYGVLVNDNFALSSSSVSDTAITFKGNSSSSFGINLGTHVSNKNALIQSTSTTDNKGNILIEGSTVTGEIGISLDFWGSGSKIQILAGKGDIALNAKGHESRTFYTSTDLYIGQRANDTAINGIIPTQEIFDGDINILSEGGIYTNTGSTGLWTLKTGNTNNSGGNITIAADTNNADGGFVYFSSGLEARSFGGDINIGGGDSLASGFAVGTTFNTSTGNGVRIDGNLILDSSGNTLDTGGDISIRGKGYASNWGAYQLNGVFKNLGSTDINSGTGKINIHGIAPTTQTDATSVGVYVTGGTNHYFTSSNTNSNAITIIGDSSQSQSTASEGVILRESSGQFEIVAAGSGGGVSIIAKGGANDDAVIQLNDPVYVLAKDGDIEIKAESSNEFGRLYSDSGGSLTLGYTASENTHYDVTSSSSNIRITSSGSIYKEGLLTAKTDGGNFTIASDLGSNDSGTINLRGGLDVSTNGGNITLGGGDLLASGYALGESTSTLTEGVRIDKKLNLNSSNGDIIIRGSSSDVSLSTYGYGNSGFGVYGLTSAGQMNSGTGTIQIEGLNLNPSYTDYSSGVIFALNGGNLITITSANTTANAINILGYATGPNTENYGIEVEASSPLSIEATGDGGGITVKTSQKTTATNKYDLVLRSNTNILAKGGPIKLLGGNNNGASGGLFYTPDNTYLYLGSKANSTVTESSSDITIEADEFFWGNSWPQIGTSGYVTVRSYSPSFASQYSMRMGWNSNNQTMSGLTIGQITNTEDITIGSATTIAGPINVYGGTIAVNANLNTTTGVTAGDVLFKASGNITQGNSVDITTDGGDVIYWADSDQNDDGYISFSNSGGQDIVTNGGDVYLAGGAGTTVPQGYAHGNSAARGVSLPMGSTRGLINTSNGGGTAGDIIIRGKSTGSYDGIYFENFQLFGHNLTLDGETGNATNYGVRLGSTNVYNDIPGGNKSQVIYADNDLTITAVNTAASYAGNALRTGVNPRLYADGNFTLNTSGKLDYTSNQSFININPTKTLSVNFDGTATFTTSLGDPDAASQGALVIQPNQQNSFTSAFDSSNWTLNSNLSALTIGKSTNTGNITIGSATTIAGPITVYGGDLAINAALTATSSDINLHASGAVTQTAAVTADKLGLHGTGTFTLTNTSNNVATIAGGDATTKLGSLDFVDTADGLTIGTVNPTGISSTGPITIKTLSGDLTITEPIVSTQSTGDAVKLYADKDATAGNAGDGNIKITDNGSVTVESGARAVLYSGRESESTGVQTEVGGESNTRTSVDATTDLSAVDPVLSATGKYGLFRMENVNDNANLLSLTTSSGTLSPVFASATTDYTLVLAQGTTSVNFTPTTDDGSATLKINEAAHTSGSAYTASNLNAYQLYEIEVTASDGAAKKTYRLTVLVTQSSVPSATGVWRNLFAGDNFDPNDDQQATADTDLVGNSTDAMMQAQQGVYSFSDGQDKVYYFRVRLGNKNAPKTSFYYGMDIDSDYKIDFVIEANLKDQTPYVAYHAHDPSKDGSGPSQTAWLNSNNNNNIEREMSSRDARIVSYVTLNQSTTNVDIDGPVGGKNNGDDTWLEFAFTESSFKSWTNDYLGNELTGSDVNGLVAFTSTSQTANGDIGGINDKTADLSKTWRELGNFIESNLEDVTTYSLFTPTVASQLSRTATPIVTGSWGGSNEGDDTLTVSIDGVTYTVGNGLTIDGSSWSVEVSTPLAEGIYDVTAIASRASDGSSKTDSTTEELEIKLTIPLTSETITVASISNLVYTGLGQTPSPEVKDGTTVLVQDTDYTLSYQDNTNVGEATVTITGINAYEGSRTTTFAITPAPLTITAEDKSKVFGEVDPELTVSYAGFVNGEDKDDLTGTLLISRVSGEAVSTYAITASGLTSTNYDITYTPGAFTITSRLITQSAITVSPITDLVYTGLGQTPSPEVKDGTTVLVQDTDYTLSYQDNTNVGTATVTVTGKGNYNGTRTVTFNILKKALTISGLIADDKEYDGTMEATLSGTASLVGLVDGDDVVLSGTPESTFTSPNVSTGVSVIVVGYELTGAAKDNYSLSQPTGLSADITYRVISVIPTSGLTKQYGESDPEFTYTFSGSISGQMAAFSGSLSREQGEDVDSYEITQGSLSLTDNGNFKASNYAITLTTNIDFEIVKAPLIVTVNNDAKFVTQADRQGYAGVSYSGFKFGEDLTSLNTTNLTITRSNTGVEAAGIYTDVLEASGITSQNYSISYEPADYQIVAADQLYVKLADTEVVYGEEPVYLVELSGYYSSDNTQVVDLTSSTSVTGNKVTVVDGASGSAEFLIVPETPLYSTSNHLSVGTYNLVSDQAVFNSSNFNNTLIEQGVLRVNPKELVVSLSSTKSKVYDGNTSLPSMTFDLTTPFTGDKVSAVGTGIYESANAGETDYRVSGLSLSGSDANNYYIQGGANTQITGTDGQISKRTISVVPRVGQSKIFGTSDPILTYDYNGEVNGETPVFNGSLEREVGESRGLYAISQGSLLLTDKDSFIASNYELVFTSGIDFTITNKLLSDQDINILPISEVIYNGQSQEPEVELKDIDIVLVEGVDYELSYDNNTDVGKATITITGLGNYGGVRTVTFNILPRVITVTPDSDQSKEYGESDPLLTYTVSGAITGETPDFSNSLSRLEGENVGRYQITQGSLILVDNGNFKASNYEIDFTANIDFTISKASLTITVNNDSKFVTQADVAGYAGVSYSGFKFGEDQTTIDTTNLSITRSNLGVEAVGVYPSVLEASGVISQNYDIVYQKGDYTIIGADQLLVKLKDSEVVYADVPVFEVLEAGYYNSSNELIEDLTSSVQVIGTEVTVTDGTSGTAVFDIVVVSPQLSSSGTLQSGSYVLESGNISKTSPNFSNTIILQGNLNVTPKELTVSLISSVIKEYDGNDNLLNLELSLTTPIDTDIVLASGAGVYDSKDVGVRNYTVSGITLSGADAGNYFIQGGVNASITGTDGEITKRVLTVTPDANQGKTFGESDPSLTYSYSGLINGEMPLFSGTLGRDHGEAVGSYQITQGSLVSQDNGVFLKGNYELVFTEGEFTITAKSITDTDISVAPIEDFVYTGQGITPPLTVKDGATTLVQGTDYGLDYSNNINVGTSTVTIVSYGNYNGTRVVTFDIIPAPLTITADAKTKEFGEDDPELTVSYTGFVNGEDAEDLTGTLSISRESGESVGSYAITALGLTSTNYAITYQEGIFTITSKSITDTDITVSPITDLVYNGSLQRPKPMVEDDSNLLDEGIDYRLSYSDNTNVGTATITITGIGNYNDSRTVRFMILPKVIEILIPDQEKDYGAQDPVLVFTADPVLFGSDEFTGVLSRESGEAVGEYSISSGTLSAGDNYTLNIQSDAIFRIIRIDSDGDGVADDIEETDGTDPTDSCDFVLASQTFTPSTAWNAADCDSDGVSNADELTEGTDPLNPDSDGDGVLDGTEKTDGTDGLDFCSSIPSNITLPVSQAFLNADCDGDGLSNGDEIGPDVKNPIDSDNDGVFDYLEFNNHTTPIEDDLEVFNLLTPNNDGENDVFVIRNIELYPENTLEIYNRWGVKVYSVSGYGQNGRYFIGISNGRGVISQSSLLPTGTYFYILKYKSSSGGFKERKGYLYLTR